MEWYRGHCRDLPWRRTNDPYRIWVSEIMLQQTRVDTVIPYYERFLAKYPDAATLAAAPEQELLAAWAGLGYYSRARNMQRAARLIAASGFPDTYESIRALPGVGDYTAAAIASIGFGLPHAVLDGNVMRVMSRVTNDPGDIRSVPIRKRLQSAADALLDPSCPGTFNQALMELGATLCGPADPKCLLCPVHAFCEARRAGRERELPVKSSVMPRNTATVNLLIIRRGDAVLMWKRDGNSRRLAGFWELPDAALLPAARIKSRIGRFQHSITNTTYTVEVSLAEARSKPANVEWVSLARVSELPLSTMARKAVKHLRTFCKNASSIEESDQG